MTGFGEASAEREGVHFFVEVRSLNSKYFKATIRLPEAYQGLEAELDATLRRLLVRGTVTFTGSCTDGSESAAYEINHRALERYIEQIRRAPMVAKGEVSLDVASLLGLPGVLQAPANEEERLKRARAALLPLTEQACAKLLGMRAAEGKSLREDLLRQRDLIADRLARIAERAPGVVSVYEARMRTRIEAMLQSLDIRVDPVELIREIAAYAERTDIAEETSRLAGHIEQFTTLLAPEADRPVGRTLDFLSQEMLREANTIASKSPDSEISKAIVEVKGAIDRIKEQVQNVE
ncbi:MAG: YicC/YloC family endoribonuclease [Phycisphaerales bacterium]